MRKDETLSKHRHTFQPSGEFLPWNEDGMTIMESMLLRMTPYERKQFGSFTMSYAHLGIMPDIYWNQGDQTVEICTQGKAYFRFGLIVMYLKEGRQVHFNVEE